MRAVGLTKIAAGVDFSHRTFSGKMASSTSTSVATSSSAKGSFLAADGVNDDLGYNHRRLGAGQIQCVEQINGVRKQHWRMEGLWMLMRGFLCTVLVARPTTYWALFLLSMRFLRGIAPDITTFRTAHLVTHRPCLASDLRGFCSIARSC